MSIALRNLLQDKLRLILSVAGVALAVMLILILSGILSGVNAQVGSYLANTPGAVVVAQGGVVDFFGTNSVLPANTLTATQQMSGVSKALPLAVQTIIFEVHGRKQAAVVVGYDPAQGGGPWHLAKGQPVGTADQVVVDAVLAGEHNIGLGDKLTLEGKEFTVVGLSDGTSMWAASLMFVSKDALAALLGRPGMNSFLLVTPAAGVSPQALRDQLANLPALQADNILLKSEMIANDTELLANVYTAPLTIMVVIAFLVGALVVGLIIYTATMERQREYGVLKAIGAHNGLLYRVIIAQALIAALAGSLIGVALAYLVGQLIALASPQLLVAIGPVAVGGALLAGLVMALLGSILPARSVARLAPAEVFRS